MGSEIRFSVSVEQWDVIQNLLTQVLVQGGVLMGKFEDLSAQVGQLRTEVGRLGPALANIRDDVARISAQLIDGVTPEQAVALGTDLATTVTALAALATQAEEIAAITPEPPPA